MFEPFRPGPAVNPFRSSAEQEHQGQEDGKEQQARKGAPVFPQEVPAPGEKGSGPEECECLPKCGQAEDGRQCPQQLPVFGKTKKWLDLYFAGRVPDFLPPLSLHSSPFRESVWKILLTIPYGHTMTYGEIASALAREKKISRMSAQAVGGAVGHNPISIIIPCHRVVGTNGSLTGYACGIDKKIALLKLEGVDMDGLFVPKKGTAL